MGRVDLAGKLHDARARVEAETAPEDRGLAKFARLTRKDARVRADQHAALTALAKTLMRRRRVKAERITERTRSSGSRSTCSSPTPTTCTAPPRTNCGTP